MAISKEDRRASTGNLPWRIVFFLIIFSSFFLITAAFFLFRLQSSLNLNKPSEISTAEKGGSPDLVVAAIKSMLFDEGLTRKDTSISIDGNHLLFNLSYDKTISKDTFIEKLRNMMPDLGYELAEHSVNLTDETETTTFLLRPLLGRSSKDAFRITLAKRHISYDKPFTPRPKKSRVAIIIDDLGLNMELAEAAVNLPFPVTISILPRQSLSEEVALMAAREGKEILMHLPMEPLDFPEKDPGPGSLMHGMDYNEMRHILEENIRTVPGAVGINNHMGSRLTSEEDAMDNLMSWMSTLNLIFLDSLTTLDSVAYSKARSFGLKSARRDIFLDNDDNPDYIQMQLEELIRTALGKGEAIGIGHPRESTISVLEKSMDNLQANGIDIVPLSSLAK